MRTANVINDKPSLHAANMIVILSGTGRAPSSMQEFKSVKKTIKAPSGSTFASVISEGQIEGGLLPAEPQEKSGKRWEAVANEWESVANAWQIV